jgi:hypothetical protein
VSEATGIDIEDIGRRRVLRTVRADRKGGKEQTIPLASRTAWLVDEVIGDRTSGPLFVTTSGNRMDRRGAARVVARVVRKAHITKRITPHSFRHTFVTLALDAGQANEPSPHPPDRRTAGWSPTTTATATPSPATPPTPSPPGSKAPPDGCQGGAPRPAHTGQTAHVRSVRVTVVVLAVLAAGCSDSSDTSSKEPRDASSEDLRDLEEAFPAGVAAVGVTREERAYDEIELQSPDETLFKVTVYREFDEREVANATSSLPTDDGSRAWSGATDPDLTSIYYLGANGVGLRISNQTRGASPMPQPDLIELAEAISTIPSVVDRAGA